MESQREIWSGGDESSTVCDRRSGIGNQQTAVAEKVHLGDKFGGAHGTREEELNWPEKILTVISSGKSPNKLRDAEL